MNVVLAKASKQLSDCHLPFQLPFPVLATSKICLTGHSSSSISNPYTPILYFLSKIESWLPHVTSNVFWSVFLNMLYPLSNPYHVTSRHQPFHLNPPFVSYTLSFNILMVIDDVLSLYTNIPYTHSLSAIEKFLSHHPPIPCPATQFFLSYPIHPHPQHLCPLFQLLSLLQVKGTHSTQPSSWETWSRSF